MKDDQEEYYARQQRKADETAYLLSKLVAVIVITGLAVQFFRWLTGWQILRFTFVDCCSIMFLSVVNFCNGVIENG
jgi:hypothetical protein